MSNLIQYWLLMILKDAPEFAINIIIKNPTVFKVFLEKVFELHLYYQIFGFKVIFMLMPLLNHWFAKKWGGKRVLIEFISFSNFKVVFILLSEPVIILIWVTIIKIEKLSLKRPLLQCNVCPELVIFLALNKQF